MAAVGAFALANEVLVVVISMRMPRRTMQRIGQKSVMPRLPMSEAAGTPRSQYRRRQAIREADPMGHRGQFEAVLQTLHVSRSADYC